MIAKYYSEDRKPLAIAGGSSMSIDCIVPTVPSLCVGCDRHLFTDLGTKLHHESHYKYNTFMGYYEKVWAFFRIIFSFDSVLNYFPGFADDRHKVRASIGEHFEWTKWTRAIQKYSGFDAQQTRATTVESQLGFNEQCTGYLRAIPWTAFPNDWNQIFLLLLNCRMFYRKCMKWMVINVKTMLRHRHRQIYRPFTFQAMKNLR